MHNKDMYKIKKNGKDAQILDFLILPFLQQNFDKDC